MDAIDLLTIIGFVAVLLVIDVAALLFGSDSRVGFGDDAAERRFADGGAE